MAGAAVRRVTYLRSMSFWPTRRHSLALMWKHRRGAGVVRGSVSEFAWDLVSLSRKEWGLWAVTFRAYEEGPRCTCPNYGRGDVTIGDLNRNCPLHGIDALD